MGHEDGKKETESGDTFEVKLAGIWVWEWKVNQEIESSEMEQTFRSWLGDMLYMKMPHIILVDMSSRLLRM